VLQEIDVFVAGRFSFGNKAFLLVEFMATDPHFFDLHSQSPAMELILSFE